MKLPKKIRDNLIEKFQKIQNFFKYVDLIKRFKERNMPSDYFLMIHRILDLDFSKLNDIKLIMLSGMVDFVVMPCAPTYLDSMEIMAFNELNDAIFEMKHCDDNDSNSQKRKTSKNKTPKNN